MAQGLNAMGGMDNSAGRILREWIEHMCERRLLTTLRIECRPNDLGVVFVAERNDGERLWCTERVVFDEELHDDAERALHLTLRSIQAELWGLGPMREQRDSLQMQFNMSDLGFTVRVASRQQPTDKAEARAERLFTLIAGAKAHDDLVNAEKTPVRGSAGTAYHLLRRRTYSVTRDEDGAAFCAVVPGVPLWDHLLGVKLMIEHDEPAFLRVANRSAPSAMQFPTLGIAREGVAHRITAMMAGAN